MRFCSPFLATLLLVFALSVPTARGDEILTYAPVGATTLEGMTMFEAAIIPTDVTAGSGLNPQSGASTYNFNNWDPASTNAVEAIAADDFWTWGFEVDTLGLVTLDNFQIRLDRSGSGPQNFEVLVSVNGDPATSVLAGDVPTTGADFTSDSLAGLGLLTGGDAITFTLAAFNSTTTDGTFDIEELDGRDDGIGFVLNGTAVAVPEPSSLFALGSITSAVCWRRRRRA